MSQKLVIVIPAYNEERNISWVLKQIPRLSNFKVETLVIDDGSEDTTASVAEEYGAIVINNKKNTGLGQAVRKGLNEALKRKADIIITLDADGQYNPVEIKNLLRPFEMPKEINIDLVLGTRLQNIEFNFDRMKILGNKIISLLVSFFISRKNIISDTQTGFRSISKDLAVVLVKRLKGNYTYTQEMIFHAKLNNFRIIEIPIHFYPRRFGRSRLIKNPFIYLFRIMIICVKTFLGYKLFKK